MCITVSADGLAPDGARASAGIVLTELCDVFVPSLCGCYWLPFTLSNWMTVMQNGERGLVIFEYFMTPHVFTHWGRHFADTIFKCIFFYENCSILIKASLEFVPKGPINNNPALVQVMLWWRPGNQPLAETMVALYTDTYVHVIPPQ